MPAGAPRNGCWRWVPWAGVLVPAFNHAPNNQLGDGVDGPDKAFNPAFPWLATPHSGFEHRHDDVPQVIHFGAE